jgi:hypothetical protein
MEFVMDKTTLGQVVSDNFDFPCQFSFHRLLHAHHYLSSGPGAIGQIVADVPSGLNFTPPQELKNKSALLFPAIHSGRQQKECRAIIIIMSFLTGSTALVGPGLFFSFLIYSQSVRLLGPVISSSQGLYLSTGQHKHRINTYTHQTPMP